MLKKRVAIITIALMAAGFSTIGLAAEHGITAFTAAATPEGGTTYSLSLKIMLAMAALTMLPALLMAATSFTRIIIVLSILRQAIGVQNIPTNQILLGITLLLTFFVMAPVFNTVHTESLQPYFNHEISEKEAFDKALTPFRTFMLNQTRNDDLTLFLKMSNKPAEYKNKSDIPLSVLMTAFITSELKTAFQIGFVLFIPFLIIDLVVASILMSMGMMMLSPLVISLPFKILLFVLVNGWVLVLGTLSSSFLL